MLTQSKDTVNTVANAVSLATAIVQRLAGNEVANTLDGAPVNRQVLDQLIASRINANLANRTRKGATS